MIIGNDSSLVRSIANAVMHMINYNRQSLNIFKHIQGYSSIFKR